MNRFKIRLGLPVFAVAGVLAVLVALLSGCGAGQVSQMAVQEPAVNGNKVTFNHVALRDIRIQANQTGDYLQPGRTVDLVLVAVNQSPSSADRLVGITSDIGTVTVSGDPGCPPADRCSSARRKARRWRRARWAPTPRRRGPPSIWPNRSRTASPTTSPSISRRPGRPRSRCRFRPA